MKCAIFDFDGTLVDSQWCWQTMLLRVLQERGYEIDEADVEISLDVDWLSRHEELCKKYGAEPLFADHREFHPYMERFYRTGVRWKPGAEEYLRHLKAKGVRLAVFSVTPRYLLRQAIATLGAEDLFDEVFSGSDRNWSKKDPQAFRNCMAEFGATPEDCVLFEDSLYSISTAKEAGMTVWAVKERCFRQNREKIRAVADRFADRLTDFIDPEEEQNS